MRTKNRDKVFIIGLDGATWTILTPLIQKRGMPNLSKMVEAGVSGSLESTDPPMTGPAWTSFQTGLNVGSHGVFDFLSYREGSYVPRLVNSRSIRSKTIWDIASEAGKTVVTINVPMTYPPKPVNGACVGGLLTPNEKSKFTYPESLFDELIDQIGDYKILVQPTDGYRRKPDSFVDELIYVERKRFEAAKFFMKKYDWDLFMIHFQSVDTIQHALWHHIDLSCPDYRNEYLEKIQEFYLALDGFIGKLANLVDDQTIVIIMSDHGFGPNRKYINLNEWLKLNNFLTRRKTFPFVSFVKDLIKKADFLNLRDKLMLKVKQTELTYRLLPKLVDWSQTKAFVSTGHMYGHIYLNVMNREPKGIVDRTTEYDAIRDSIAKKLARLRDPETGENVVKSVVKREEIYSGSQLMNAPDLIAIPCDGYCFSSSLGEGEELFIMSEPSKKLTGQHRKEGMVVMIGNNLKKNALIKGGRIVDMAPTILYCLSLPVPLEMEGKVLKEAFDDGFIESNVIRYSDTKLRDVDVCEGAGYRDREGREVAERLRDLGYL